MTTQPDLRAIADQVAPPDPALQARIAAIYAELRAAQPTADDQALLKEALRRAVED